MTFNSTHAVEASWNPLAVLDTDLTQEVKADDDQIQSYLVFELRGQWLATSVSQVREILDDQPLTCLPNAPSDVEGMIDLRETSITVVDMAQHLGIRNYSDIPAERIVVFEFDRPGQVPLAIGVRTDTVRDVCQIQAHRIEAPPEALSAWDQSMITGVARLADRMVILIDFSGIVKKCTDARDIFDFA